MSDAPDVGGVRVVRPSLAARRRALAASAVPAIPLLVVGVVRFGDAPLMLPALLGAAAVLGALILLVVRARRIEYGGGRYRRIGALGRRRFEAADVVIVVRVDRLGWGASRETMLAALDARGARLLRLVSTTWEPEDLALLGSDLHDHGAGLDAIGSIDPVALRRRYPRLVAGWEAHPVAAGVVLAVAIVVIACAVAVATSAATG